MLPLSSLSQNEKRTYLLLLDVRTNIANFILMTVTASKLRANVYRLIDQVLETGQPLEVERKGRKLLIIPEQKASKLSRLVKRPCLQGDPEKLVHIDWSREWKYDVS